MSDSAEIRVLTTPQELFAAAAEEVVRVANLAVAEHGRFTIEAIEGRRGLNALIRELRRAAEQVA